MKADKQATGDDGNGETGGLRLATDMRQRGLRNQLVTTDPQQRLYFLPLPQEQGSLGR